MQKNIHLITSLIIIAFGGTAIQAATYYWDLNGPTTGAGGPTPSGTWDIGTTMNWSTDSAGGVATSAWANGNDAVFSAGTDATGAFSITLSGSPTAGNLTVEEGAVTISGGTTLGVGGGADGKGIIRAMPNAAITINSTVQGWDANLMLSLVGTNSTTGTINGTIVNASPYTRVEKREPGTWVLTGTNTYSGVTDVRVGTLVVSVLADGGQPSSIGTGNAGLWHAVIGLGGIGSPNAILKYVGTGHSTSRQFCLWGPDAFGGTIDASGTGPLVLRGDIIHNPNPNAPETVDKLFTLTGDNMGTNTLSGQILDSTGGFKTSVKKDGPGKWVLFGSHYYSGSTAVAEGTLVWNAIYSATEAISVNSGGILGGVGIIDAPVTIADGGTLSPGESVGNLTIYNDLNLAGNLFIEVNKPTNDFVSVYGTLSNTGTGNKVTVKNVGGALSVGDRFQIFDHAMANGGAMAVVSDDGSVVWANDLGVDGSISVAALVPPPLLITSIADAGTASVTVNYSNTVPTKTYYLLRYQSTINGGWTTNLPGKVAAGTSDSQVDSTASGSQRYYQVFYVSP